MKGYRSLIPIAMTALMIISIYSMVSDAAQQQSKLNEILANAKSFTEQGLYDRATECYNEAMDIDNSSEYYVQIIEMYYNAEEYNESEKWCEKAVLAFPKNPEVYSLQLRNYITQENYAEAFSVLDEFDGKKLSLDKVEEYRNQIKYLYYEDFCRYDDVKPAFSGGYIGVCDKNLWGLATDSAKNKVEANFKDIGYYSNDLIPVMDEKGIWYFMDDCGVYKYNISNYIHGNIKSVGLYNNELFSVCIDDKYSFYNLKFEKILGDYDYAGAFNSGVAAVKKDNIWQIIDSNGKSVTKEEYSDVILDPRGICCIKDRIFVQTSEGSYKMIDSKGEEIGSQKFGFAKLFTTNDSYAAVMIDNLWGFIDLNGNIVISPKYSDAKSFSMEIAAVCENEKWGYINLEETKIVNFEYDECMNFSSSGLAFVRNDSNWNIIKLYMYNH